MHRWDPCTPGFVVSALRVTIALWLLSSLGCLWVLPTAFWGVISGGFVALASFLIVIQAGRRLSPTARYARLMLGLFGCHLLLWVMMAVLLAVIKVHPLGFLLGASVLPVAILGSLSWYLYQQKRMPS